MISPMYCQKLLHCRSETEKEQGKMVGYSAGNDTFWILMVV
ncbi:hypothetical protein [Endozoicomonas sp.]|nr:hypothetical protein [Endozoicomonas sp.]